MAHNDVKVYQEQVTFKTYLTGQQDQHPIFLEHRVYQGSSGAVYPYGVTDTLLDKTEEKAYKALILENDFIKVMVLPELGGRVHRAFDKVHNRDFVYFNHVVKPALVGLLGPWISGGIEFNWPQHHRPTTYMPVDSCIKEHEDGSATIYVGEREPMHGLTITTAFTLYKDKALLEIKSKVFNGNDTPRSFLWWSNPAVKGGDGHQSIFPPDVTAVFDHGKRAVIDFPIAHGEYYKIKYDGVDISRYKNLPVPTSYMAWRSDYDFVGAYNHEDKGGLLHIADHHVSPGKKQWSWGYSDFGQAWDRNLTDEDGPYIELMTGVYTDNQPDFTWLDAGEEKEFVQNFLPYSDLATVHNANTTAAIKLERNEEKGSKLNLGVYAIAPCIGKAVLTTEDCQFIAEQAIKLEPCESKLWEVNLTKEQANARLKLTLVNNDEVEVLSYLEHIALPTPLPELAKNPPMPKDIKSVDEAYFIGQHLEQYHHATRHCTDYYLRGLELDNLDYRCNVAMANYEYNRGDYEKALKYVDAGLERAHMLNRNTSCGLGSLIRAHALLKLGRISEAYDEYFRATWAYNGRTKGYLGLGLICSQRKDYAQSFYFAERSLQTESNNPDALALKCLSACLAKHPKTKDYLDEALGQYPLSPVLAFIKNNLGELSDDDFAALINKREINYINVAEFLCKAGRDDLAFNFLHKYQPHGAIANLIYAALMCKVQGKEQDYPEVQAIIAKASDEFKHFVRFPNLVFERDLLASLDKSAFALHLCASFDYSHRLYESAAKLWSQCLVIDKNYVEALRGLGIYAYNKLNDTAKAQSFFEQALAASNGDERILFEHDLLLKLTSHTPEERLAVLEKYDCDHFVRDDLKAELVTLYNQTKQTAKAQHNLASLQFHVWEGGEGRVTSQFINNALLRAHDLRNKGNYKDALSTVENALTFPHNLGEGKLSQQTDNDLYFFAAYYATKAGDNAKAKDYLAKAQLGDTTISEQQYYNDLPCDYVFYNALAKKVAGKEDEAHKIFETMKQWSYDALNKEVVEDFFAVSLPDLVVLDRDLTKTRKENCLLMRILSSLGLGDKELFEQSLDEMRKLQPSNYKLPLYETLGTDLITVATSGQF